jgi:hypothetical protein
MKILPHFPAFEKSTLTGVYEMIAAICAAGLRRFVWEGTP